MIDQDGKMIGIINLQEAISQAERAGLDLAEISPQANPPIAKIIDWDKYRYEQTKQLQKSRKHQKTIEIKQVRVSLKISQHDFEVKIKQAERFLTEGSRVKVSLLLRGREITHQDLGRDKLEKFYDQLKEISELEQTIQLTGHELSIVIGAKRNAKTQNP